VCWQLTLCDPHLSALEVRFSRRCAIQIDVYLTFTIKGCCADNAVGLDCQRRCRCVRQPEVQSKVDVLGAPPATAAEAAVAEHRLNLARSHETDRENS